MGAPNQELSQTANFIINGNPDLLEPDDDDFVDIMNAACEVLRGMGRRVSWPKIEDQLKHWLRIFTQRGDTLPPNLTSTRGLLLRQQFGGGEPYYFLGEDLKIYTVYRDWHDGSGRRTDDARDWIHHTPVLRKLTIEELRDLLNKERYGGLLQITTTLVNELRELQKGILDRAAYVGDRADTIEAIAQRIEQAEGR